MLELIPWAAFILFIIAALWLDLVILHTKDTEIPIQLALKMSAFWVSLAMMFCVGVYFWKGPETALVFLTGYLIEESLSLDNLFVFIIIFNYFQVPAKYQPKVLFLGILGAIIMRLTFILAGIALISNFHWMIYVFGVFLIYTGAKLSMAGDINVHPEKNLALRLFKKIMPTVTYFHGSDFFVKVDGRWAATPLFVAVIMIETSDVIFAVDSIPAIMAITLDPFIIYTSNIFAILGLRSLFFALSGLMRMFHYLNYGLSLILVVLGLKMTLSGYIHVPVLLSLGFIATTLLTCVLLSLRFPKEKEAEPE
ncbi:MAG: TerC family protein [Nitrospinota bacterium]|nr:TerC family protein [Nitrospinota bacterium]MDH5678496.1 TerC family protein [Nitrospinota bacterium]MDH5756140.1 TerC family protein [Nitrospinota bacterium]